MAMKEMKSGLSVETIEATEKQEYDTRWIVKVDAPNMKLICSNTVM